MWITWRHQDTDFNRPLEFAEKVEIFYHQTLGWQLHIADLVANGGKMFPEVKDGVPIKKTAGSVLPIRHSGFPVLQICLSYFETLGRYTGVTSGSKAAFVAGVKRVFPQYAASDFAKLLYNHARCGLYHNVRSTQVGVALLNEAVQYDSTKRRILICPERFPGVLKLHLDQFRNELLQNERKALGKAFEYQFDVDSPI
jgi:hypothetical protein